MAERLAWRRDMLGWEARHTSEDAGANMEPYSARNPVFNDAKGLPKSFGSVVPVDDSYARGQCASIKPGGEGDPVPAMPAWCTQPPCSTGLAPRDTAKGARCCKPNAPGPGCPCPKGTWPDPMTAAQDEEWKCVPEPPCACPPGVPCKWGCKKWGYDAITGKPLDKKWGGGWFANQENGCTLDEIRDSYLAGKSADGYFLKVLYEYGKDSLVPMPCGDGK